MKERESRQRAWAVIVALVTIALVGVSFGPRIYRLVRPDPRLTASPGSGKASPESRPERAEAPAAGPAWAELEPVDRASAHFEPGKSLDLGAPGGMGRLELPGEALERSAEVSIVRYEVATDSDAAGYALDLLPDGLELAEPALLSLPLPQGVLPAEAEIVVMDPDTGEWIPEPGQAVSEDGRTLVASLSHFSIRRIRIRPGLAYPTHPAKGRATLRLESDHGNAFERYVDGRWHAVARESASYRELMRAGRRGRHALILNGRLRAVAAGLRRTEIMRDHQRTVSLPPDSPFGHTGWVLLHRLDAEGRRSGESVIARVAGPPLPDDLARVGVVAQLSRATMAALGLRWGVEMGLDPAGGELAWIRVPTSREEGAALAHLPVELEPYEGAPARAAALPM